MSLQYHDDEDDLFDSNEEDEEESENELSAEQPPMQITPRPIQTRQPANANGGRQLRIRPMKLSMMQKHPSTVSILLTQNDGRQLLFVRK